MSDEYIVLHCSPTLAGLKTANMFTVKGLSRKQLGEEIRLLNRLLTGKGLRAIPLRQAKGRSLIYIYRPALLARDLAKEDAKDILAALGYKGNNYMELLRELTMRLRFGDDFPHEIGLFLGYPPEDVRGFMNSSCNGVKCSGCWKVYGDAETAQKTFSKYKHCTDIYCKMLKMGRPLSKMIVR